MKLLGRKGRRFLHRRGHGSSPGAATVPGVTGVILAGGASSRMGSNKALLPYRGGVLIEAVHRQMAALFDEVLVITNTPEQYQFIPCAKAPDLYPGMGALAGLHSGLRHSRHSAIFVAACDMPHLDAGLIQWLATLLEGHDVVMPRSGEGWEPLHAFYHRHCLPAMESALQEGKRRIVSFLPGVRVREVMPEDISAIDPRFSSFSNINTPVEYHRLRDAEQRSSTQGHSVAVMPPLFFPVPAPL